METSSTNAMGRVPAFVFRHNSQSHTDLHTDTGTVFRRVDSAREVCQPILSASMGHPSVSRGRDRLVALGASGQTDMVALPACRDCLVMLFV